jgi:glutathione peroxidase
MRFLNSLAAVAILALMFFPPASLFAQDESGKGDQTGEGVPPALDFTVKSISGEDVNLADYKGKVLVVVNVASRCGYTRQYADLQKLYSDNKDSGLVVLGFPCNQFGGQEPKTEAEILEFCKAKFEVSFDMFSKIDVKGDNAAPFYKHLTALETAPKGPGDVGWNFEKFVIDRKGNVVGRFSTKTEIADEAFMEAVNKALAQRD